MWLVGISWGCAHEDGFTNRRYGVPSFLSCLLFLHRKKKWCLVGIWRMTRNSPGHQGVKENSRKKDQTVQRHGSIDVCGGFRKPGGAVWSIACVSEQKNICRLTGSGQMTEENSRMYSCPLLPAQVRRRYIVIVQNASLPEHVFLSTDILGNAWVLGSVQAHRWILEVIVGNTATQQMGVRGPELFLLGGFLFSDWLIAVSRYGHEFGVFDVYLDVRKCGWKQ